MAGALWVTCGKSPLLLWASILPSTASHFFVFLRFSFKNTHLCVCLCVGVSESHVYGALVIRALDPLELELQVFVSHQMRELGTKLGSSGRAADALKHQVISSSSLLGSF